MRGLPLIPPDEMIDWRRFLDRYQIEVSAMYGTGRVQLDRVEASF